MPAIAIDTETTGPYLYHGCQPFMLSACSEDGDLYVWEFEINPRTREVNFNDPQVDDIYETLADYDTWVFHNEKFDLRALELIDPDLLALSQEKVIEDTLYMSHIVDTASSHGLKDLGILHLDILDDDEEDLKTACRQAQALVLSQDLGWLIARRDYNIPSLPNHDGEFAYCDYWLPGALYKAGLALDPSWANICQVYAEKDVERTILLYRAYKKYIEEHGYQDVWKFHANVYKPVMEIEKNGIRFFRDKARETVADLESQSGPYLERIQDIAGREFNINSPKQLQKFLYEDHGLPILAVTKTKQPATDKDTLNDLLDFREHTSSSQEAFDFIEALLEVRLRETSCRYIRNYLAYAITYQVDYNNGEQYLLQYLHPSLNSTGTKTTRFSSSNPNGQNISKGVQEEDEYGQKKQVFNLRELFGPPPGYVWYCIDYSSLQLIIFAYESQDKGLIQTLESGGDPHNYVACGLFETDNPTEIERRIAKNVNYGLIFGAGKRKIDMTAGRPGAYALYNSQFPGIRRYMQNVIRGARKDGQVYTSWGYPITVPLDFAYKGVNYIVQGDEGEIVKRALVYTNEYLKEHHPECTLILTVHDELIFQAPEWYEFPLEDINRLMMKPAADIGWHTPVDAAIVRRNWGEKEKC